MARHMSATRSLRPSQPERRVWSLARLTLATVLTTGLAAAQPIGSEHLSTQHGSWHDPAVWDTGVVPSSAFDGSIAHLRHSLTVSAPAAASDILLGREGWPGVIIQEGGDLECLNLVFGVDGGSQVTHHAGTTSADHVFLGYSWNGILRCYGGTLSMENLYMGGLPGVPSPGNGILDLRGAGPVLSVAQDFVVHAGSSIDLFPQGDGVAGLTPIEVGSATFEPGSTLWLGFEYPVEAGHGWDLLVSDTPIVGLPDFELHFPEAWEVAFDTSDPFVLRAVVLSAPWPIWTDLGGASAGINGQPTLVGTENLLVNFVPHEWTLTQAPANAPVLMVVSGTSAPIAVLGGTLHAHPWDFELLLFTDAQGDLAYEAEWPVGIDAGLDVTFQFLCLDPSVLGELTLSNGIRATTL